jgi:hypothetical protein
MSYKTSWLRGAAHGINAQLAEQRKANMSESAQSSALVVTKDGELAEAVADLIGKTSNHKGADATSQDAYREGHATGKGMGLHRQVKTSQPGTALAG